MNCMNWNCLDDRCTAVITLCEELETMNAPTEKIEQIIQLYLEYEEFKSKDWRTGFRQALFLALKEDDYIRFIEGIG